MSLRSTFLGVELSKRGLSVSQKGLDITSNNVANIHTEGYTRQRVDVSSVTMTGRYLYSSGNVENKGQGADVDGVAQIRNKFLDVRYRDANANTEYYNQAKTILTGIQDAIDEISSEGLLAVYQEAVSTLESFATDPSNTVYATTSKAAINKVNQMLKTYDSSIIDVAEQQIYDTNVAVNDANTIMQKIASINHSLMLESNNELSNVYSNNELNDQLNLLIDKLSAYGDIRVTWNENNTAEIEINGHVAVKDDWSDMIQLNTHEDYTVDLVYKSTGEQVTLTSGSLKADTDYINGDNTVMKGIQYYMHQIDAFANKFGEILNNTIPEYVYDDNGNPVYETDDNGNLIQRTDKDGNLLVDSNGNPLYQQKIVYKQLVQTSDGSEDITAGNISISDAWTKDTQYIMKNRIYGDTQNTDYLDLISKLTGDVTIGVFTGTLEEFTETINTDVGEDITYIDSRHTACTIINNSLEDARDEISGVALDEEGASLLVYQKAYSAMARCMTAFDEVLNVTINNMGLVGRG